MENCRLSFTDFLSIVVTFSFQAKTCGKLDISLQRVGMIKKWEMVTQLMTTMANWHRYKHMYCTYTLGCDNWLQK